MKDWEANVRRVTPYVPGEQPREQGIIKLNTNENPYDPAPAVTQALSGMRTEEFRLYPDPAAGVLVQALADYHGVDREQVFVGVGSDDVLSMCFLTFFHGNEPVLFPDITYSFYDVWAGVYRIPYETRPLDENFHIVPEDYLEKNGGIIFPNPNAPTGLALGLAAVERIAAGNPASVVIVDEAYVDFGGETALPLVGKYDNLLVVRTYSKSRSMAGMRIGYAIGSARLISYLNDVKYSVNSYTMNLPSIVCGAAALSDEEYFQTTVEKIKETRARSAERLTAMGFTVLPSAANFLFAAHKEKPAAQLLAGLRERRIYVRHFDRERISNYLRITIGTDEQMDALFDALSRLV